jgi:hypothetical protein
LYTVNSASYPPILPEVSQDGERILVLARDNGPPYIVRVDVDPTTGDINLVRTDFPPWTVASVLIVNLQAENAISYWRAPSQMTFAHFETRGTAVVPSVAAATIPTQVTIAIPQPTEIPFLFVIHCRSASISLQSVIERLDVGAGNLHAWDPNDATNGEQAILSDLSLPIGTVCLSPPTQGIRCRLTGRSPGGPVDAFHVCVDAGQPMTLLALSWVMQTSGTYPTLSLFASNDHNLFALRQDLVIQAREPTDNAVLFTHNVHHLAHHGAQRLWDAQVVWPGMDAPEYYSYSFVTRAYTTLDANGNPCVPRLDPTTVHAIEAKFPLPVDPPPAAFRYYVIVVSCGLTVSRDPPQTFTLQRLRFQFDPIGTVQVPAPGSEGVRLFGNPVLGVDDTVYLIQLSKIPFAIEDRSQPTCRPYGYLEIWSQFVTLNTTGMIIGSMRSVIQQQRTGRVTLLDVVVPKEARMTFNGHTTVQHIPHVIVYVRHRALIPNGNYCAVDTDTVVRVGSAPAWVSHRDTMRFICIVPMGNTVYRTQFLRLFCLTVLEVDVVDVIPLAIPEVCIILPSETGLLRRQQP